MPHCATNSVYLHILGRGHSGGFRKRNRGDFDVQADDTNKPPKRKVAKPKTQRVKRVRHCDPAEEPDVSGSGSDVDDGDTGWGEEDVVELDDTGAADDGNGPGADDGSSTSSSSDSSSSSSDGAPDDDQPDFMDNAFSIMEG